MSKILKSFAVATLALLLFAAVALAAGNEIRMAVERNAGPGSLGELPPPAESKKDAADAKKEPAEAKKPRAAKPEAAKPEASKPQVAKPEATKSETATPLVKVPDALRAEPAPKKKTPRKKPAQKGETAPESQVAPAKDAAPTGQEAALASAGAQGVVGEGAGAVPAVTEHPGASAEKAAPVAKLPAPVSPEKMAPTEKIAPAKPVVPASLPAPIPATVPVAAAPAPKPKPVPAPAPAPAPVDPKAFVMPAGPSNAPESVTLPADTATGQFVGEVTLEFKPDRVILRAATNGPVERTTHFNMDNPRKLAIDLRGPWRKKGGAVVRYDTGPVKVVVAGEHPDRLRLAVEFREGAVRPEVSPTVELGPKGVTVTIPLAR